MRGRLLFLVVALGLSATGLAQSTRAGSCEECIDNCNMIPMAMEDCLELYCLECAGASSPAGSKA